MRPLTAKTAKILRVREVPSSNLGTPTRHVSRLPTRGSLFLLIPCDYHLKKVIITTKSGLIGGAYVKDQLFTSHAKIPARHWGHPLSETTAKNCVNRFAPFLVEDLHGCTFAGSGERRESGRCQQWEPKYLTFPGD